LLFLTLSQKAITNFTAHGAAPWKSHCRGWWNPYRADLRHTLYSVSKSFTATASARAGEGKLSLDDNVISFFPGEAPAPASPYLAGLKIRHLLSMSVGHASDPTVPSLV